MLQALFIMSQLNDWIIAPLNTFFSTVAVSSFVHKNFFVIIMTVYFQKESGGLQLSKFLNKQYAFSAAYIPPIPAVLFHV